jgi:glycosyltransferase involved in cell wall biosynthesis
VSVVMPVYNHARFLSRALASLAAQSVAPAELIAVDDGSTDGSYEVLAAFARAASFPVSLVRQPNAGASVALNRGMALARHDTIALMNSDDVFAPRRLETLTAALDADTALAFSDCDLIDEADQPAVGPYATRLRERIDVGAAASNLLYPLISHNVATTTGNLLFRRSLLEAIGGFAPLAVCHDWDFVLAASYATRIAFVRHRLYGYRLHGANTFGKLALKGIEEGELALDSFFQNIDRHPWLDAKTRADFYTHARAVGLGGYLRP